MNIASCALVPLIVILFTAALVAASYILEVGTVEILFSEQGFFEQASPLVWIFAGFVALWKASTGGMRYFCFALTFFLLAGREWGMHKAFTSDSILKINFYKDGFGMEQIFGGLAMLLIIGLILSTVVILVRYILIGHSYKKISGQFLIAGLFLLVVSKIMDRAPAILRVDFGIVLDERLDLTLWVLEEGFEFLCPALIMAGIIYYPPLYLNPAVSASDRL